LSDRFSADVDEFFCVKTLLYNPLSTITFKIFDVLIGDDESEDIVEFF